MANINRDLLLQIDVKKSTVTGGNFQFYITDKHTSNFFVQLVFNMSTNQLIKNYVTIENASDYGIELVLIKPSKEILYIEATLIDESKALFLYDLSNDQMNEVGEYRCEFRVTSIVNHRKEIITSDPFTFKVQPSIVNGVDGEFGEPTQGYPLYDSLNDRITKFEEGQLDVDINLVGYATLEYVDQQIDAIELLPGPQGEPGVDGKPFTYDMFTEEQLAMLKGDDGYTPVKGVDYFTEQDKAEIAEDFATIQYVNDAVAGVDVTSQLTNYATKTYVNDKLGGLQVVQITQVDYDALPTKDANTLYIII